MSKEHPVTKEEWEAFSFPARPLSAGTPDRGEGAPEASQAVGPASVAPNPDEVAGEEESQGGGETQEGGDSEGGEGPEPWPLPPQSKWVYDAQSGFLMNRAINKQIDLDHLSEVTQIMRWLSVFELRPDLDYRSLRAALEAASQERFATSLDGVLDRFGSGRRIPWKAKPQPTRSPPRP